MSPSFVFHRLYWPVTLNVQKSTIRNLFVKELFVEVDEDIFLRVPPAIGEVTIACWATLVISGSVRVSLLGLQICWSKKNQCSCHRLVQVRSPSLEIYWQIFLCFSFKVVIYTWILPWLLFTSQSMYADNKI